MIPGTTPERSAKALKRARANHEEPEPEVPWVEDPADHWDANPILRRTQSGEVKEFFTIKFLAQAWDNRTIISIRKLERMGVIPRARYRTNYGRRRDRLYSREQIEAVVRLAKEFGVYHTNTRKNISKTGFTEALKLEW